MNFKEALIAHPYAQMMKWKLEGNKVEGRVVGDDRTIDSWGEFPGSGTWSDEQLLSAYMGDGEYQWEFRLAPRTITVNGVEVPAPESVAPDVGVMYYYPHHMTIDGIDGAQWCGGSHAQFLLQRGLVYLNKEDAIARAKAMLITKEN